MLALGHDRPVILIATGLDRDEQDSYTYTQQLLALESCKPVTNKSLPPELLRITSSARVGAWAEALAHHPDRQFADYVIQGFSRGFRIGFKHDASILEQAQANMRIANFQAAEAYISKELEEDRLVQMTPEEATAFNIHCSPLGIIPKKNQPGKWRLIVDLSSPAGASVNDGIDKELCSLSYISVDAIAGRIAAMGKGTLIAKMDIKQAYRMVPVHPDDRRLLGMKWEGKVYVDKCLPFGLRSAPLIFSAIADALAWIMRGRGVSFTEHYIDDFITLGGPRSEECKANQHLMLETCEVMGVPIENEKSEGPSTSLVFLGIELDSVTMEMRLPADKLRSLKEVLISWRGKKAGRKRDILSLIGSLAHACKVVKPGRAFVRRIIELSKQTRELSHFVRLNKEARSDIEWWYQFAGAWNGVSLMNQVNHHKWELEMTSDVSGSWGWAAVFGERWLQLKWPPPCLKYQIMVKELVPIVLATALWGRNWTSKTVMVFCDNAAVVSVIDKGSSKEPDVMHLLRCLAFIQARYQFNLIAAHIKGENNNLADALSRDNVGYFLSHYPQAQKQPTPVPIELLDLTIIQKPDWTSRLWTDWWTATFETG